MSLAAWDSTPPPVWLALLNDGTNMVNMRARTQVFNPGRSTAISGAVFNGVRGRECSAVGCPAAADSQLRPVATRLRHVNGKSGLLERKIGSVMRVDPEPTDSQV